MFQVPQCEGQGFTADKAVETCAAMSGQLARIVDTAQFEFIKKFLEHNLDDTFSLFISGHDEATSDRWVYHGSDLPVTFFDWAESEPYGHVTDNKHCMVLALYESGIRMRASSCHGDTVTDRTSYLCTMPEK